VIHSACLVEGDCRCTRCVHLDPSLCSDQATTLLNPKHQQGVVSLRSDQLPDGLFPVVMAAIQGDAPAEYAIWAREGRYPAYNANHELQTTFAQEGVEIRSDRDGVSVWNLRLVGYGYGEAIQPVSPAEPQAFGNRVEYQRGSLTEWYLNGPLGVEQGFTLHEPPVNGNTNTPLILALDFPADLVVDVAPDGQSATLKDPDNQMGFVYGHLYANDATGRRLPIHLNPIPATADQKSGLQLVIDDQEAVYPLTVDPMIQLQTKLVASDKATNDVFGYVVAMSGDTVIIGAENADLPSKTDAGAAYVFVRNGSTWTQQAILNASDAAASDWFGNAVAIHGNTAVVGALFANVAGKADAGAAYVFVRDGTTWSEQAKLIANDGAASDLFGNNVAVQDDFIFVGAPTADLPGKSNAGAVYVFQRNGTVWSQIAKLTADDSTANDQFGAGIAVSGDTLIIGAPDDASLGAGAGNGAVYVFIRSESSWTQHTKLTASDGAAGDEFGAGVSLSGDTLLVAARLATVTGSADAGAAYVFVRNGTSWSQQAKLTASDKAANDQFGVLVSVNGDNALIGAYRADLPGKADTGAAYLFVRNGSTWTQQSKITATDSAAGDFFGASGVMADGIALVGARYADDGGVSNCGAVYVFQISPDAPTNTGSPSEPFAWGGEVFKDNAIGLRTGEKMEVATDLSVTTPAGPLAFTRTYRQNKRATYQFMGLGWMHDHALSLTPIVGTPNKVIVQMPNGGELNLSESSSGSNHYVADPGSGAVVDYNAGSSQYTLTGSDKYYGQVGGQSDANQLDFLIEVVSPSVDTTGDGTPDGTLSLEQLVYTTSGATITNITQNEGNAALSTAFAFQPGGQNITTETLAGKVTTHSFDNGVYVSQQDPAGNVASQAVNLQYRPDALKDQKGNRTEMVWGEGGKLLHQVKDALGNLTTLNYNGSGSSEDTLNYSINAEGRKTQYTYGDVNNPRLPTRIQLYDTNGTTILHWQEYTYDTNGRVLTDKLFDPTGTTVQKQTNRAYYTSGNGNGLLQTVTEVDLPSQANNIVTTHFYDALGRVVKVSRNSTFGTCQITYTVYDNAGHVVATICNYDPGLNPDPTTAAEAVALYDPVFPDKNRVTTYEYDTLGRQVKTVVDAGAAYAETSLTVYDSLSRVVRTIRNYVPSAGIADPYVHAHAEFEHGQNNDQNLITETVYNERGLVRKAIDVLGNVRLLGYDDSGRLVRAVENASQPHYNNTYGAGGDPSLSWYKSLIANDKPDEDIITVNEYDAAGNVVKTTDAIGNVTLTVYDALNRPVKVVQNASQPNYNRLIDPTLKNYIPSSAADQDLIDLTEYDAMGRVSRQQDEMGNWTLFVYDGLGRVSKTIRNASKPHYNRVVDPTFKHYVVSTNPDQDRITERIYDLAEREMYTVDVLGRRDWTAYDGLGREVKTIDNALGTATDGGVNDPRSDAYKGSLNLFDQDQVSLIHYDTSGRVWRTRDNLGNWTLFGYDTLNRQVKVIDNASNFSYDATNDTPLERYVPAVGAAPDQDVITQTLYNGQGQIAIRIDELGNQTRFTYDRLERPIKTVENFITGVFNPARPDQDRVSLTSYDVASRVISTVDARGTQTTFAYDKTDRRRVVTRAANTPLATKSYICYDKAGRMVRQINNWIDDPTQPSPDARDGQGNWLFVPVTHGSANDQNLITTFTLDRLGRPTAISNPVGNSTAMTYDKDGQQESMTDPLGVVTKYRYDKARRRTLTVESFQSNGEDPALWKWNGSAWTKSDGSTAIAFGTDKDQNLITQVEYDKVGRQTAMRDPRGNRTTYTYDQLDRRTSLTDPRGSVWATAYAHLPDGTLRLTLTDPNTYVTQQEMDRLGRLVKLQYLNETPSKVTPDITFTYDKAGNRLSMNESDDLGGTVRKTNFTYDRADRLVQASFDRAGDGLDIQVVGYEYDAGGLRTKLTLPGSLNVVYTYNEPGQLVSLTHWDSQATQFAYDAVYRLATAQRANNLLSSYQYDPAGRLSLARHTANNQTLGHFAYTVDARGNRTQVYQGVPRSTTGSTTLAYNDPAVYYYQGTWSDANPFKESTSTSAALRAAFLSSDVTLTMGKGPDHGIYDIYVDGTLQQTVDGYAAAVSEQAINLTFTDEGPHTLEVRNTGTKNASSTGFKVRYKTLATPVTARLYDLQTMAYGYDAAVRLKNATTYPGVNTAATPTKSYAYGYDVAGNRTQQVVTPGGTTNYTYDAANRLISDGTNSYSYDNAGRMTGDGVNTYAWDRANRLLSQAGVSNLYNGLGQRVQQTVSGNVTKYVLDVQPELWEVLAATTGANTTRYVQGLRGLHAQEDHAGNWTWPVEDGLGSVYGVVNNSLVPQESRQYSPVGELTQLSGSSQTVYGFTGEPMDGGVGLVYLRARYLHPALGQFISLDTLETDNRYAYVDGDPVNQVDPSGLFGFRPSLCADGRCNQRASAPAPRPQAAPVSRPRPAAAVAAQTARPRTTSSAQKSGGGTSQKAASKSIGARPKPTGGTAAKVTKTTSAQSSGKGTNQKAVDKQKPGAKGKPQTGAKPVIKPKTKENPFVKPEPWGSSSGGIPNPLSNLGTGGGGSLQPAPQTCLWLFGECVPLPGQNPPDDDPPIIITIPPGNSGADSGSQFEEKPPWQVCIDEGAKCNKDCQIFHYGFPGEIRRCIEECSAITQACIERAGGGPGGGWPFPPPPIPPTWP